MDPQNADTSLPQIFCWTKMGAEAGQSLDDILRRKELERQSNGGVFAWGIGNSVGAAIAHARTAEKVSGMEAVFTPMRSAPRSVDSNPSSLQLWLGYHDAGGGISRLPDNTLVTSRGHGHAHYALLCHSGVSLLDQAGRWSIESAAATNLVSGKAVGASQVTAVIRLSHARNTGHAYPVMFRASLTGPCFVRLAMPVVLEGEIHAAYCEAREARTGEQWRARLRRLLEAANAAGASAT